MVSVMIFSNERWQPCTGDQLVQVIGVPLMVLAIVIPEYIGGDGRRQLETPVDIAQPRPADR
jgi:hypothetical protein